MNKIKIYIDLGHGGSDPGACNDNNKESMIVLNVYSHLKKLFGSDGRFEIKFSRESDIYKTLEQRSKEANSWGADIFISIHVNSSSSKSANGVETFCYKFKYRKLADHINNGILQYLSLNNRGVKEGNFHVIRETKMSACLTELAFISNDNDLKALLEKSENFAKGIYKGTLDYYNIKDNVITSPNTEKLYIVGVGAYSDINNAKNELKKLKELGLKPYIHVCEGGK